MKKDIIDCLCFAALLAGIFYLLVYLTPNQCSAECEAERAEVTE